MWLQSCSPRDLRAESWVDMRHHQRWVDKRECSVSQLLEVWTWAPLDEGFSSLMFSKRQCRLRDLCIALRTLIVVWILGYVGLLEFATGTAIYSGSGFWSCSLLMIWDESNVKHANVFSSEGAWNVQWMPGLFNRMKQQGWQSISNHEWTSSWVLSSQMNQRLSSVRFEMPSVFLPELQR